MPEPAHDTTRKLAAARIGSTEALGQVLDECRGYLLMVAQRELDADLLPKGGASDLVQQTMLDAVRDFAGFQGDEPRQLQAWLRHLLLNNLTDFTRLYRQTGRRQVDREVRLDAGDSSTARNGLATDTSEFLEGESLRQRLSREPRLSMTDVLRIGRQSAQGLAAAHARGMIHRDVKPANIWLERRREIAENGRRGEGETRAKLLDFGLARIVDESAQLTQTGAIVGTPAYIAPEQASGLPADQRSDLFSLGCVLYRLCTGKAPFEGPDTLSTLAALALLDPRPPHVVNPEVPPALSDLIVQLLARKPADRTSSAWALAAALDVIQDSLTVGAGPPTVAAVALPAANEAQAAALPSPRRRGWSSAIAALAGAAILAATVLSLNTRHGTLVVNVMEPDVQVVVDGDQNVTIDSKRAGRIELVPGEHELTVKRGEEELLTTSFTLKSGGDTLVVARWEAKQGAVVRSPRRLSSGLNGDDTESTVGQASPPSHQDDAWIRVVSTLRAELQVEAVKDELKKRNPGFDDSVQAVIKDGVVINLYFNTDQVTDILPVRVFGGLELLNCNGQEQGQLSDLSPLSGMALDTLQFAKNRVEDLAPLATMPALRVLHCSHNPIKDLSPLAGLSLKELLCDVSPVNDLSPLKGMKLKLLHCAYTRVRDLTPLVGMPLEWLACSGLEGIDLSVLKDLPLTGLDRAGLSDHEAELLRTIKTLQSINGRVVKW